MDIAGTLSRERSALFLPALDFMMPLLQHHDVRTTLTLDEDVAEKVKREAARTGASFKETVNQTLRNGLLLRKKLESLPPFRIEARDLGLRPGLDLNNIEELLDLVDGPNRR